MGRTTRLAAAQRRVLERIGPDPRMAGFYLVGGTALALHLAHRASVDLDLFSRAGDADLDDAERALREILGEIRVLSRSAASLQVIAATVPIDVVRYRYPLLEATVAIEGTAVAGLRDLAAMKLAAIARRGIRRDYWDLRVIVEHGGQDLASHGRDYLLKFGDAADLYHVARSLVYFDDAEREAALPRGMTPAYWEQTKEFFREYGPGILSLQR